MVRVSSLVPLEETTQGNPLQQMSHLYLSAHLCFAFWYELRVTDGLVGSSLVITESSGLARLDTEPAPLEGVERKKIMGDWAAGEPRIISGLFLLC